MQRGDVRPARVSLKALLRPPALDAPEKFHGEIRGQGMPVEAGSHEWLVADYATASRVLHDPAFAKPTPPWIPIRSARTALQMFIIKNPPDHGRLRGVVQSCFSPHATRGLERVAYASAKQAFAQVGASGTFDFMHAVAKPVPFTVICGFLAVPDHRQEELAALSTTLTESLDAQLPTSLRQSIAMVSDPDNQPVKALKATARAVAIARSMLRDEDATRTSSVVTALREAVQLEAITEDEAVATWILLFVAGHETTVNLIANTAHCLVSNPESLAEVQRDPRLIAAAIDETLRLEPPVIQVFRTATRDTDCGGRDLRRKDLVHVLVGGANRDPQAFPDPNRFDLHRPKTPGPLSFGFGIHHCIGAAIARAEATAVITALLETWPTIRRTGPTTWRPSLAMRSLSNLLLEVC